MPDPFFLGVDGGNTKTLAIVVDASGRTRGVARGGLGDIYGAAEGEPVVEGVLDTARRALAAAGVPRAGLAAAAFRLAGVDWPEDAELWAKALDGFLAPGTARSVLNDGFACLRCGDRSGRGVAVSLGTGAAIAGRGPGGREFSMSWWLRDYLGAAGLGHDGIRAAALAELGMAPPTALTRTLPEFFGVADVEGLLHLADSRESRLGHADFARVARVVIAACDGGDAVAAEIVDRHAARTADYVGACARRVGLDNVAPISVVLGGSVAGEPSGQVRRRLLSVLAERMPQASVTTEHVVPILGCALDALAEGGVTITRALHAAVLETTLGDRLLAT